ncbi:MAG: sulfatase-like hydrolase/transferase [Opitutaceae bacterium]|nr:sulfatase-like hydrolase/transferase [Opitutaceae bacterium]
MRLPRRDFLRLSAAGAGLTILPSRLRAKSPERPPNLLFLWTDQQRSDTLGFLGNRVTRTPNLDGLARQSAVLTNTRVVHPVCIPSRGAFSAVAGHTRPASMPTTCPCRRTCRCSRSC